MANNDLGVRFTEERYATKNEVIKTLGTSLVDSIWSNILLYRTKFNKYTKLHDVSKSRFSVCLCDSIISKNNDLMGKFTRLNDRYSLLKVNSLEKYQIDKPVFKAILRDVAYELKISVNDVALENIILGKNISPEYLPLLNYYKALLYVENYHEDNIDDDLLAKLFSLVKGETELTSFYRTIDLESYQSKALINREYEGIPARLIETSMNNLFDFLADEEMSLPLKLSITYYMINYVKRFEKHNSLIAILLIKYLLARNDIAGAIAVPFEHVLKEEENLKVIFKEVQKTRDLTYIVSRFVPLANIYVNELIDSLVRLNVSKVRDEFYGKVEEEVFEDKPVTKEEVPIIDEVKVEEKPLVKEEPSKEEVKPAPKKERKPYEHKMVKEVVTVKANSNEQALSEMEEDMLESDPSLKYHQAHFYVRHNTPGKFYTIQQYKRLEGCVYETARTSMDNLAKKGYYKREQIKNKFVYTPIKKD